MKQNWELLVERYAERSAELEKLKAEELRNRALIELVPELLAIVKRFEWSEWSNGKWCCPECGRMSEPVGEHRGANPATNTAGCSIGLVLAKALGQS